MLERALARFDRRRISALRTERAAEMPPGLREPHVVAVLLEDADCLVRELGRPHTSAVWLVRNAPRTLLQRAVQLVPAISRHARRLEQTVEQRLCSRDFADRPECAAQLSHQLESRGMFVGRECECAVEEVHGRGCVIACKCALPRRAEQLCSPVPELAPCVVDDTELPAIPERLLEVVADDLVDVAGLAGARVRRPVGVALVLLGAELLRDTRVRSVADENVAEAVRVLASGTRREEILARE